LLIHLKKAVQRTDLHIVAPSLAEKLPDKIPVPGQLAGQTNPKRAQETDLRWQI
jgi:hypothetical protein